MTKISAVIFDLGGVLLRTEDQMPRNQLAKQMGVEPGELARIVFESETAAQATVGAVTEPMVWGFVGQRFNLNQRELEAFQEAFWAGDVLDMGLVDFLRSLRPDRKTALLSNAWDGLRRLLEDKYPILDAFDRVIISAEVNLAKPDARIYQRILADLETPAGEAVFVDDMPTNVEAARSVGMHAIRFVTREQVLNDLKALFGAAS